MKQVFAANLLRQGLAVGLIGLFYSGSFYLAQSPQGGKNAAFTAHTLESEESEEEEEEGEDDGDRVFADRPDLALEQELALTRDPATGLVPRQRLLDAARYNETMLAKLAGQRPAAGVLSGATWTERGPSNVAGRVRALLIDPRDTSGNTIWAGSVGGGLWKATNATSSSIQWTNVNSFLTNLAVTTIAVGPASQPAAMYCGTGEGYFNANAIQGAGIWKSTDGGTTWAQLPSTSTSTSSFSYVQKIVVHPTTGDVYAATRSGLWRSQNGGSTWTAVLSTTVVPATTTARVADIEIAADNTLFVAMGIFSTDGIYRSTTGDAGSWAKLNALAGAGLPTTGYQRIELACAPSDANRVYALFQATTNNSLLNIYRSMDKGNTWVPMARPGATTANPTFDFTNGQGWYDLAAGVSPADANALYVGGLDLWFVGDAGKAKADSVSWSRKSSWSTTTTSPYYVHADHHAIAFVPTTTAPANKAFFASDGGVAFSADASVNTATQPQFGQRNTGLNVTQFYALAMHPTNYNFFLAGAQDNGTQRFTATGVNATTMVTGGDGGLCAIDQDNPAVQFTSYVYNQYRRSVNGGTSFTSFNISATLGSFINPWEYDSRDNILYACHNADSYLAWTNPTTATNTTTATTITPSLGIGAGKVTHVSVSPRTRKRIYIGTNSGKVLLIDSAHTTSPVVRVLRPGAAGTSVSCIAIDPTNENHLLATYSNYGIVSVYETRDADAPVPTWSNVEGALPDMPVRWALIDPRNPARAMLATEMGVYSTELLNGSATVWTPASSGLAYTRVDMLRYRPGDQVVAAATHGRGLFTSDVFYAATGLAAKPSAADLFTTAYPNPFSSELNLDLAPAATRASTTAYLADALGRRVFSTTVQPASGSLRLTVPASVAPGTYTLVVNQAGRQTSRRVTKR